MPQERISAIISPPMKSLTAGKTKSPPFWLQAIPILPAATESALLDHRDIGFCDDVGRINSEKHMGHYGIACNHHFINIFPVDPCSI
ncbi:MAG: hypothetical protein MZU84_02855 [Sphingobacterium sp.]|nr:hypothetical protein [Sphingobacterium sp.]